MTGVLAILGAVTLLAVILRVGTAALIVSGVSRDVARFQVRSAFFGVGYTTTESEQILNHPFRRKLVQVLMLLGSIGITGVIGSAVLTFARTEDRILLPMLVLGAGLALLWLLLSWRPLDRFLVRTSEKALRRYTSLEATDVHALLRLSDHYAIRQVEIRDGGRLDGRSVSDLLPAAQGVVLLGVERGDEYLGVPTLETTLHAGDRLAIYGRDDVLDRLG